MTFPRDFAWGAATAAFQIEGATAVDGRGESIWDRFAGTPGKVHNGDTGDPACEHYYRWREDLDLMSSLGLRAYRFSISWPRIQPDGRGPANQRGLDFYRGLVEGLRERGIAPLVTLYHWDLPQALEDEGGWASRETVGRFADYAELVFDGLGDLVEDWTTHNEPWVTSFLGYALGTKAPGATDWRRALRAAHHALLSHGTVVRAFRDTGRAGRIGITLDLTVARPFTQSDEDVAAARRLDGYHNGWFLDPIFRGAYPAEILELYEERFGPLDAIRPGDLETIAQPLDYLGVNFYRPNLVEAADDGSVLGLAEVPQEAAKTAMGWPVVPEALTELLVGLKRDYGDLPLLITENGAAFVDRRNGGDVVEDPSRLAYIERHLAAVEQAIAAGVDVRGYFVWSLLDNFEWEHGYSQRFGIVYVDFETQRRIPKRSALWYRDRIAAATGEVA
jgi:beta-glucosidase